MPVRWLQITVRSPSGWEAELLAEGLIASGAMGVEQRATELITYYPAPPDPAAFADALRVALRHASGLDPELEWEWRPDADWSAEWRRGLDARRVGERLVVSPSWVRPETRPGDVVITIDPQMAFGTGEHATTRGVLRLLEVAIEQGDRVLDVGTGSGILAIAAGRLGAVDVLAVENDGDALVNARENLHANGATCVRLLQAEVTEQLLAEHAGAFDLVLANVLSGVLRPLLPGFRTALHDGGRLILSGILQSEADGMASAARAAGFDLLREDREEEWWTVLLRRR